VVLHGSIVAGLTSGHAASGASHYSWLSGRRSDWAGGQLDLVGAADQDALGRVRCLPGRARQG
jgi:hypothetical protein